MNRNNAYSFYHYDGLDSVMQLTDAAQSPIVSYMYDGYGNIISTTGTSDNTYGYTGEQQHK